MIVPAFTTVYSYCGKEFREVPNQHRVAVSIKGEILRLNVFMEPDRIMKPVLVPNTKVDRRSRDTYYLNYRYKDTTGRLRYVSVHYLVCMAWNGLPPDDGIKYDVNHKNSIKTDNHADNLEWSTRSQNIAHCFDEGKNAAAVRIIAKCQSTGEEKIFRSIKNFAEVIGLHRSQVRAFIAKHSYDPHNGYVYRIEEPRNFRIQAKKYQVKEVAYKDYLENKIVFASSFEHASLQTGIQSSTIKVACNRFKEKGTIRPIKRYFFQYLDTGMKFPDFTVEELKAFEESFERRSAATSGSRL